ncbi:hypothetical protein V6N13_133681 [Hibiscus sabdariffa]
MMLWDLSMNETLTRSLAWGRQRGKGDRVLLLFKYGFCDYGSVNKQWGGSNLCISGLEYRYQHGGIGTDSSLEFVYRCSPIGTGTISLRYRYLYMGIGTVRQRYSCDNGYKEVTVLPSRDIVYNQVKQLIGLRHKPITLQDALPRFDSQSRFSAKAGPVVSIRDIPFVILLKQNIEAPP